MGFNWSGFGFGISILVSIVSWGKIVTNTATLFDWAMFLTFSGIVVGYSYTHFTPKLTKLR